MLALDAAPGVRAASRRPRSVRTGSRRHVVEAEDATLAGDASVVTPASLWTGESLFGGTGYASLRVGGTATLRRCRRHPPPLLMPVVDLRPAATGGHHVPRPAGHRPRPGRARATSAPQGASPAPGRAAPGHAAAASARRRPHGDGHHGPAATSPAGRADGQPLVTRLVLGGDGHGTALLRSAATTTRAHPRRPSPAAAAPTVRSYDGHGRLLSHRRGRRARRTRARRRPEAFALVRR